MTLVLSPIARGDLCLMRMIIENPELDEIVVSWHQYGGKSLARSFKIDHVRDALVYGLQQAIDASLPNETP